MMRHPLTKRILLAALLSCTPALGDSSVAAALGLKDSEIAAALEDGAARNLNQDERAKDPAIRGMNAETSYFLRNAPSAPRRQEKPVAAVPRRSQKEQERDEALRQLEFRRNVEDAMKQILAFSPAVRQAPESPEARIEEALAEDVNQPADSRDRLLRSAVRTNPFRDPNLLRGIREEVPRMETNQIDQRIVTPPQYEASAEDDEGKPVRVGLSGDGGGADFPVINLRQGSRKMSPGIRALPPIRDGITDPPNLKPLKGLFETGSHSGGFGR